MSKMPLSLMIARIPPKVMLLLISSLAIAAGFAVSEQNKRSQDEIRRISAEANKKDTGTVLLANIDIAEGSIIEASALRLETMERSRIPFGALENEGAALGLQARVSIQAGQPLLSQFVSMKAREQGFEDKIKPGLRAVTFPVDASTGVAGFLSPDCHVDILAQTGSGVDSKAVPILSDVVVVAVGQTYKKTSVEGDAQQVNNVTVAVKPSDGGKLINAMAAGRLYCLMRNKSDRSPLSVRDISSSFPKQSASAAPEISSIPTLPIPQTVQSELPIPPDQENEAPSLHNIQTWAANKKDELNFPKK